MIERCIDQEHGERAITHYEPVAVCKVPGNGSYTMLRLQLETGRTHQIRVHMKAIGHPLVGDYLYAPENCSAERPLLHSRSLEFSHPVTEEQMKLTAELPEDMKYYAGKDYKVDDYKFDILNAYKEFLKANEGFTKLKKTDDIKLPDCLKVLSDADAQTVIEKIEKLM